MNEKNPNPAPTSAKMRLPEYDTYLFDADGTLIDTAELVVTCFLHVIDTLKEYRRNHDEITPQSIKSMMGLPLRYQMERYFGALSDSEYEHIHSVYSILQENIYHDYLRLFPGVSETLSRLKAQGKKLGVVTSRRMVSLRLYLETLGIFDFFDDFITPEATEKHKPDPEPVLEAMKRLAADPDRTVFTGDAIFDIQAGNSAGIDTVFVEWSHNSVSDFTTKPTYTIGHMEELVTVHRI